MGKLKTTKMVYGRAMVGTDAYKKNLSSKRSKRSDQKENGTIIRPQSKPI